MKKTISSLLVTFALGASLALAQGPGTGTFTPPNPATLIQRRVARLTTLLTLLPDQQTQATTIFTNAATALTTVMSSMKTARATLRTAVQNNDIPGINQASATIGTLTGQLTAAEATAEAAFYAILNADQKAKVAQLNGPGMFGPGGFGGPGRFGPMGGGRR